MTGFPHGTPSNNDNPLEASIPHPYHSLDENGVIITVNEAWLDTLGYGRSEVEGRSFGDFRPNVSSEEFDSAFAEFKADGHISNAEFEMRCADGETIIVSYDGAIEYDDNGDFVRSHCQFTDITELRQYQQDLERVNDLFEQAQEIADLGAWETDLRNNEGWWTEQVNHIYGLPPGYEPDAGEGIEYFHPEDQPVLRDAFERAMEEGEPYDLELRVVSDEGPLKWVRARAKPIVEDGEVVRVRGTLQDITDSKKREQEIEHLTEDLQESLQQLKVIDRVLRHNFHNDMNVILGYAENIQETSSGAAAEDAATIIEKGEQLITTVDKQREITDLLSKPEPSEAIVLGEVIDAGVAATREQYPEAQITVESSEDHLVRATKSIDRALTELLTNAVVHSDQTEPTIEVTVEDLDDAVAVRIADDGPGIPDMERKIVTGEAEIEPLYHSSGLGLWLVKSIVQKSGGSLAFEENDPRGSIVSIRLPTAAVHDGDE